jgi:hypothetical protein
MIYKPDLLSIIGADQAVAIATAHFAKKAYQALVPILHPSHSHSLHDGLGTGKQLRQHDLPLHYLQLILSIY